MVMGEVHVAEGQVAKLIERAGQGEDIVLSLSTGSLSPRSEPARYIPERLASDPIAIIDISMRDPLLVASLPHHHRDPFDRLLVAQAQAERLTLVTNAPASGADGIPLLRD